MRAGQIQLTGRIANLLRIIKFLFFVVVFPTISHATFSAGIMQNDYITLGADSRATADNGGYNDDSCKIIPLQHHTAFTLQGRRIFQKHSGTPIDILELLKDLQIAETQNIDSLSDEFALDVVNVLNKADIDVPASLSARPVEVVLELVFAGFRNGNATISQRIIGYNHFRNQYAISDKADHSPRSDTPFYKLIPFGSQNEASEVARSLQFTSVLQNSMDIEPNKSAQAMYFLVKSIIDMHFTAAIGGLPNVFILTSNENDRWYSQVASCNTH